MGKSRLVARALGSWALMLSLVGVCYPQGRLSEGQALTGGIKGRVILGDGRPCVHCAIEIERDDVSGTATKYQTRTDDKGDFLQLGIPSARYLVCVEFPITHLKPCLLHVPITAGAPTETDLDFSKQVFGPGTGQIFGTVRYTDGRPCSTCTIVIEPTGNTYGTETDSQGNFRYLSLPAGTYNLTIRLPDGWSVKSSAETYVSQGKQTTTELALGHLSGQLGLEMPITGPDGKPSKLFIPGQVSVGEQQPNETATDAVERIIDRISRGPHQITYQRLRSLVQLPGRAPAGT